MEMRPSGSELLGGSHDLRAACGFGFQPCDSSQYVVYMCLCEINTTRVLNFCSDSFLFCFIHSDNCDFCFVDALLTEITEVSDEELDALQSFCAIKINQIHCQLNSKQSNSSKLKDLQHGFTSEKPVTGDLNCTIPDQLVNRIHLKNISETMKQVKETKLHQPSQCHDCKKKLTELAKITFLRQKKTLVENALFQDKLEEQIYVKDSLTLIGEIHKNLPKLSEDPRIIWQRLNEKGQKGESYNKQMWH
uniref:Chromosome 8 open reading frame 48 n=1 Tax=Chelonoidis abingdonii TaxID=106734 RepID=A0A8C0GNG0_CHEAB